MIASAVVLLLLSLLVATEPDHSGPAEAAQPDGAAPQHPGLPAAADRPAKHHRAA